MECTVSNRTWIMRLVWLVGIVLSAVGMIMHSSPVILVGIVLFISGAFGGGGA